jgi:hypothetical protein
VEQLETVNDLQGGRKPQPDSWQKMSNDKENRMATFAEDATMNTYIHNADGFKQATALG